jgi:hypothetical protein
MALYTDIKIPRRGSDSLSKVEVDVKWHVAGGKRGKNHVSQTTEILLMNVINTESVSHDNIMNCG